MIRILIGLAVFLWIGLAQAQTTKYVTDRLEVTLRTGQSTSHKVVRMLPSGTPLKVMEVDEAEGYTRVQTPDGQEGWVITRYLIDQPVARERLQKAEDTIKQLRAQLAEARNEVKTLSSSGQSLQQSQSKLEQENKRLSKELADIRRTAGNALSLDSENKTLKKRLFELERDYQMQEQETSALKDRSDRDWFLAGAGVLVAGMVLGLILPKVRWRKKSDWGSL